MSAARGTRVERAVRRDLEAQGWTVSRAAGSKGNGPEGEPWDLHATKRTQRQRRDVFISLYVQCKARTQ